MVPRADRLRLARLARRLSLEALARRAGVSRFRLWQAEHGYVRLTEAEVRRLARVLRQPVAALRQS